MSDWQQCSETADGRHHFVEVSGFAGRFCAHCDRSEDDRGDDDD